jgi:hypothetical protein
MQKASLVERRGFLWDWDAFVLALALSPAWNLYLASDRDAEQAAQYVGEGRGGYAD